MKPIVVLSNAHEQCATFFWKDSPQYYVGYRLIEHDPQALATSLAGIENQPACRLGDIPDGESQPLPAPQPGLPNKNWLTGYSEPDPADPIQLSFQTNTDGTARCSGLDNHGAQKRELFLRPAEDGVWLSMRLTTQAPIAGAFCVQQCLRFSGNWNEAWRRTVAHTPFLSELDVQAMGHPDLSLTHVRQDGRWLNIPMEHARYPTAAGRPLLGGTGALAIAHGLVVRETLSRQVAPDWYWDLVAPGATWASVASGLYWERTAYVSNRHPADCVHASVDFGPLSAGQSRTLHGKFYFVEGTKDDLLAAWRRDFPINNPDV
jgi:hypothetical protein